MKKPFTLLAALLFNLLAAQAARPDAQAILLKTAGRLAALQTLQYHYAAAVTNYKDNYFSKASADCYLEFAADTSLRVTRFQFRSAGSQQVYNGSTYFALDEKTHTYTVKESPADRYFSSFTYFGNAIATLRAALPGVAADSTIAKSAHDTVLDGKPYLVVTLALFKKTLKYKTTAQHFTKEVTIYDDLLIDPVTYLPYQVIEHNNIDGAQYQYSVTYTALNTQPVAPPAASWQLASYQPAYALQTETHAPAMIQTGAALPAWTLPQYTAQAPANLQSAAVNGKLVLMDFWIKECGYCMESFAHLKALQKQYGNRLHILAINAHDPLKDIAFFYRREKPAYAMLYNGKDLARQLGIGGYPSVLLVAPNGKVIYAGDFNKPQLEKLIKANLL